MPAKLSVTSAQVDNRSAEIGAYVKESRKALRVSVTTAAQVAGMSRVTWHRIERGATSVTVGALLSALAVLGLDVQLKSHATDAHTTCTAKDSIPVTISLADYPQLKQLAWQVHGVDALSPQEALNIYERNWRHLDLDAMEPQERDLVAALEQVFAGEHRDV